MTTAHPVYWQGGVTFPRGDPSDRDGLERPTRPSRGEAGGWEPHSCVPAVYLKVAFWPFLSFLPFCRISRLRMINGHAGFEPLQVHQSFQCVNLTTYRAVGHIGTHLNQEFSLPCVSP
jgi:hypothetical protein